MKKTSLAFLALLAALSVNAQTKADYETVLGKFQRMYNSSNADSAFNLFSARVQGMMPLDKTKAMLTTLKNDLGELQSYSFAKQDESLTYYKATFSNKTLTLLLSLSKENKLETFRFLPYKEDSAANSIQLSTTKGNIYGTLTMPTVADKKIPVVLIIAGSGPTDRDGNNPMGVKAASYLMLAEALKKEGIASVRYDKRGVGASAQSDQDETSILFDDMINDAAGFITMLKNDKRFAEVIVLGHSEGSLIGMVAAHRAKANKYISLAGIGNRADKTIEQQLAAQSKEMADKAKILMDSLVKGYKVQHIDPMLASIFRPSVMPYMSSWLKYDPQAEIKKLTIKIQIIQGTTDIQVGVEEANKLKKANPAATLTIIEGMNHVLKNAPANRQENIATYADATLPLNTTLVPSIVSFIKAK